MSLTERQVADLAEEAAAATAAARQSMSNAVGVADELDGLLRRCENEVDEFSHQGRLAANAEYPMRHALNARGIAEDIDGRLRSALRGLDELDGELDRAARALDAAGRAQYQLGEAPGRDPRATGSALSRVEGLAGVVQQAKESAEGARRRIGLTRQDLRARVDQAPNPERDRAAAELEAAGQSARDDVEYLRGRFQGARDGLDSAVPVANQAGYESAELATAMRAAANPTPAADRIAPAASSETDLRRRLDGPAADRDLDRS